MEIKSLADAVMALDYLHRRSLLCDQCGERLAEYANQFQNRCEACKAPHAQYKRNQVPNELERRIVGAVAKWCSEHPAPEGLGDHQHPATGQGK